MNRYKKQKFTAQFIVSYSKLHLYKNNFSFFVQNNSRNENETKQFNVTSFILLNKRNYKIIYRL